MEPREVLVSELRREYEEVWREWGTWPQALRPRTGDPAIDAVLAHPRLFQDDDTVMLDFRADDLLLIYAAPVPRSTLGLRRRYTHEEASAAVHAHRPVEASALGGWRDWLGHDVLVYDDSDAPEVSIVIRIAYSIEALLALPPEADAG